MTDFAITHARSTDPATSHEAAAAAERFAKSHCGLIYQCLLERGPASKDEIAERTGLTGVQVDRRLNDLLKRELALPTSLLGTSKTGRRERIWTAVK